jgi:hypothetical protein
MPFAHDLSCDEVGFELARHRPGPFAAVADQANASTREPLYGRDADVFGEAFGYYLAFTQVDEKGATHFLSARRAAAIASCAFE